MRPTTILPLLALALSAASACAEAPAAPAEDRSAQATALLRSALAVDGGAGIAAAVQVNGELRFAGAVGFADLEGAREMTADTPTRIGSVSKILTTALVARLIDAGKLDADSDVHGLVPEFAVHREQRAQPITVRQLANHSSGIRHYDFSNIGEANNQIYYPDLAAALAAFADDPRLAAPGAEFHYSSFGYNLLGVAAARAAGGSFAEAIEQQVIDPLRLDATAVDHPLQIVPGRARFYTVYQGELINTFWRDSSDYYPSGGMLSSARDLAELSAAMFEDDFLSGQSRQLLLNESSSGQGPTGYSFGWQVKTDADGSLHYEHGGETNGAYAWIYYDPETRTAIGGVANYNVFPTETEAAFYSRAMAGLRELYSPAVSADAR